MFFSISLLYLLPTLALANTDIIYDFSNFRKGDVLTSLPNPHGAATTVVCKKKKNDNAYAATCKPMIFDSLHPSGNDDDLGTPNGDFGGPGVGDGGRAGSAFPNTEPRGNLLIISTDGNSDNPNDHWRGGYIELGFPEPVYFKELGLLDNEEDNLDVNLTLTDGSTTSVTAPKGGDNSYMSVSFQGSDGKGIHGVMKMTVNFKGSGAIEHITIAPCKTVIPSTASPTVAPTDIPTQSPIALVVDPVSFTDTPVVAGTVRGGSRESCMTDVFRAKSGSTNSLVCRSPQIHLTDIDSSSPKTCSVGSPVPIEQLVATVKFENPILDFGWYVALDGGDALKGSCSRSYFEDSQIVTNGGTAIGRTQSIDGDVCGDVSFSDDLIESVETPTVVLVSDTEIACEDSNHNGLVDVRICFTWRKGSNDNVCSYDDLYPATPTACHCHRIDLDIEVEQTTLGVC